MTYQAVKGTRDFYPEYLAEREAMITKLLTVATRFGYLRVESPAMESLKLLTAKSGSEISEQIFVMEKRSTEEIGLRFDITVPLARLFIQKQRELAKPVKWSYCTNMWRYEAPQKGRLREFYQYGVECFGSDKPIADAEIIALAVESLRTTGLTSQEVVIRVNNRMLLEGFLEEIGISAVDKVIKVIDKRLKLTEKEFETELEFLDDEICDQLLQFLNAKSLDEIQVKTEKALAGKQNLMEIFTLLENFGVADFIEFSPSVARGLAYYTGTVFECFDRTGEFRAILGGGRYDNMIAQFEGEKCAATGFAMGDVVIELLLRKKGLWKQASLGVDYYICPVNETFITKAIDITRNLRNKYTVDIDIMGRKLAKQLQYANTIGAKQVIFVGEEINDGNVKIKNLECGEEIITPILELV